MTDGELVYSLDDTYIHMALAKHLVVDGVWGVTAYEPSTSSSSIVWPLVLAAAMWGVGDHLIIPLALNLLLAVGMILWLPGMFREFGLDARQRSRATFVTMLVACLASLVFVGMEHILHVWATVMFATAAVRVLTDARPTFSRAWPMLLIAPVLTGARYEGLGLVGLVCVLLALRNGWRGVFGGGFRVAVAVGLLALAPVVAFGVFMAHYDLPLLPYSVQLKSWAPAIGLHGAWLYFGPRLIANCMMCPHLFLLLLCSIAALRHQYRKAGRLWTPPVLMNLLFCGACLMHMEGAITGFYARYFAYLIALGVAALAISDGPILHKGLIWRREGRPAFCRRGHRVLAYTTLALMILLTAVPHVAVPFRARNIFHQQIQMARFFDTYYAGQAVAINDIGTTAYGADVRIVDIWGLASKEVAELRLAEAYSIDDIDRITRRHNTQVAIVYDEWFKQGDRINVPKHWQRVGQWAIDVNVACGSGTVSIYAVDPNAAATLIENLRDFGQRMPKAIRQRGVYTDQSAGFKVTRATQRLALDVCWSNSHGNDPQREDARGGILRRARSAVVRRAATGSTAGQAVERLARR